MKNLPDWEVAINVASSIANAQAKAVLAKFLDEAKKPSTYAAGGLDGVDLSWESQQFFLGQFLDQIKRTVVVAKKMLTGTPEEAKIIFKEADEREEGLIVSLSGSPGNDFAAIGASFYDAEKDAYLHEEETGYPTIVEDMLTELSIAYDGLLPPDMATAIANFQKTIYHDDDLFLPDVIKEAVDYAATAAKEEED